MELGPRHEPAVRRDMAENILRPEQPLQRRKAVALPSTRDLERLRRSYRDRIWHRQLLLAERFALRKFAAVGYQWQRKYRGSLQRIHQHGRPKPDDAIRDSAWASFRRSVCLFDPNR